MSMRTFSVLAVDRVLLEAREQAARPVLALDRRTWMYQVWWLMPAQMMSTSLVVTFV